MKVVVVRKQLNLNKMRKQVYRGFPDTVIRDFGMYDDSYDAKTQAFLRQFGQTMQKKHGDNFANVHAELEHNLSFTTARIRLTAKLKKEGLT